MEYNYTREFKQPHKVYQFKGYTIPWFPDGIRLDYLILSGIMLGVLVLIFVAACIFQIHFIIHLFTNSYILMTAATFFLIWWLFSLSWDHKNFLEFLIGRIQYRRTLKSYEHEMIVDTLEQPFVYGTQKRN